MSRYLLVDEPDAGAARAWTVAPMWPLLATMLVGSSVGWAWSVFNGFAFGSPTRWREAGLVAAGLAGNVAGFVGIASLLGAGIVPSGAAPYLFLGLTTWKIGVSYLVHLEQQRTFPLYEHFGGPVASGLRPLLVGAVARSFATVPPVVALVLL